MHKLLCGLSLILACFLFLSCSSSHNPSKWFLETYPAEEFNLDYREIVAEVQSVTPLCGSCDLYYYRLVLPNHTGSWGDHSMPAVGSKEFINSRFVKVRTGCVRFEKDDIEDCNFVVGEAYSVATTATTLQEAVAFQDN